MNRPLFWYDLPPTIHGVVEPLILPLGSTQRMRNVGRTDLYFLLQPLQSIMLILFGTTDFAVPVCVAPDLAVTCAVAGPTAKTAMLAIASNGAPASAQERLFRDKRLGTCSPLVRSCDRMRSTSQAGSGLPTTLAHARNLTMGYRSVKTVGKSLALRLRNPDRK